MSHKFTLPEELEIALAEFAAGDIQVEKTARKSKLLSGHGGWSARYIPPYRAAYLGGKENATEAR